MTGMGGRIKERLRATGISQAELARRVDLSQPTISDLIRGESRGSAHIHRIARELQTTPEYLLGETDDPAVLTHASSQSTAGDATPGTNSDTVEIAEFNVAFGLGATYLHETQATPKMRTFSRAWLRQYTDSPPSGLFWATGNGPSMTPAILDNDTVLIDTEQRTPRMWDQFWAVEMGGLGMIKALRPAKDGGMRLVSINPDFPEEVAYDGEMNVVGRVVAIMRKV